MSQLRYFKSNFLAELDEHQRPAIERCDSFRREAESRYRAIHEAIDSVHSNENTKLNQYFKLQKNITKLKSEMKEDEEACDSSLEGLNKTEVEIKEMTSELADLKKLRDQTLNQIGTLRAMWQEKHQVMSDIKERQSLRFKEIEQRIQIYERTLDMRLCSAEDGSFRLLFSNDQNLPLFINFSYKDGSIEIKNVNLSSPHQEAIMKEVLSSSDCQGLLALMDSART